MESETSFSFCGLFDDLEGFQTRKNRSFAIVFQMDSKFFEAAHNRPFEI